MSEDALIQQMILDRAQAIHERCAEAAVSFYAEDIVNFDLAPPLAFRGHEATDPAALQTWFDSWTGPIDLSFDQLTVRIGGDVAFAHGLMRMTGPRVDGTRTDVWARMTLGLEKRDGAWKIVHEHQSFPTRMDGSGLSASDLHP
jgi:ketosteroid isomerase-like protein